MATDQQLQPNWGTRPLMSAKMRISLVSWIVSTETDPRIGGASPFGTFEPLKEASLRHLTFKTVFLLALGSGICRSEIHSLQRKHQTPVRLVQGVSLPLTQFSIQEPVGQRGSRQCGPSGYTSSGPNSG